MDFIMNNIATIATVGTGGVALTILKMIPNDKICSVVEKTFESLGRVCTLNLSRWSWSKKHRGVVETWLIDMIDNIFGSVVRGLIKGLRSDND